MLFMNFHAPQILTFILYTYKSYTGQSTTTLSHQITCNIDKHELPCTDISPTSL